MKEVTLPITPRQVGWGILLSLLSAMSYGTYWLISTNPTHDLRILWIMIPIMTCYLFAGIGFDGRHDPNPIHWIGYCLKLKENKTNG